MYLACTTKHIGRGTGVRHNYAYRATGVCEINACAHGAATSPRPHPPHLNFNVAACPRNSASGVQAFILQGHMGILQASSTLKFQCRGEHARKYKFAGRRLFCRHRGRFLYETVHATLIYNGGGYTISPSMKVLDAEKLVTKIPTGVLFYTPPHQTTQKEMYQKYDVPKTKMDRKAEGNHRKDHS